MHINHEQVRKTCFILMLAAVIFLSTFELIRAGELLGKHESYVLESGRPGECQVKISFFLHLQPRMASNQIAVWIEDKDGNYIKTVFATSYTAQGGYQKRPLSLPHWRDASDWEKVSQHYVDAVSGATPLSGNHTIVWDCTDDQGMLVPPGTYLYKVEGNIFWENMVIWSGEISIGAARGSSEAEPEYIPERAHRKGILLENVRAEYIPK